MRTHPVPVASLALAALLALPTAATEVYRCIGADGAVTLSDQPCEAGAREERFELTLPPSGWESGEIRARNQPLLDEYDARQARQRAERQAAEEQARARREAEEEKRRAEEEEQQERWFFGYDAPYVLCPDGGLCPPGHWPPPRPPRPPAPPEPKQDERFPPNPRAPMSIPRSGQDPLR